MSEHSRNFNAPAFTHADLAYHLQRAQELRSAYIVSLVARGASAVGNAARRLSGRIARAVAGAGHPSPAAGCRGGAS